MKILLQHIAHCWKHCLTLCLLLLSVLPVAAQDIRIGGSIFGGARKANVEGTSTVTVWEGDVHDIYGGNDIHGNVRGGTNVDIRTSVTGDIYGGGNGSYVYTTEQGKDLSFPVTEGGNVIDDLNAYRPNAPKASVRIVGRDAEHPVYIKGAVYCGGNSATLKSESETRNPESKLVLGSHVVIDSVFLGSNGKNMVQADSLAKYATALGVKNDSATFARYMQGVSVDIRPQIEYDADYEPYSTSIGSFFCGGNVGSMTSDDVIIIDDLRNVTIFDKIVAGCNDANFTFEDATGKTVTYEGGLTGNASTATSTYGLKVRLDFENNELPLLRPGILSWDEENKAFSLDWNLTEDGMRLQGANVYGGCNNSGIVNGGVQINIRGSLIPDNLWEVSGIDKDEQREDVFCHTLTIFGGGYGGETTIKGNTDINIFDGGNILQVFGGGEKGVVEGNTSVTITGGVTDVIYGGGFEGLVKGQTTVNLDGGTIYDAFGGSCNANIGKWAEIYIGKNGIPEITDNVYGGNDFGGKIMGEGTFPGHGGEEHLASAYVEYHHGKVDSLFGGSYGNYDYIEEYAGRFPNGRPSMRSSFVNISSQDEQSPSDAIGIIFGGSQGCPDDAANDAMQFTSYILVDVPKMSFRSTNIYGAGCFAGLGPADSEDSGEAYGSEIDLYGGLFHNIYGGSYSQGYTYNSQVNVPAGSTMHVNALYGGGQGTSNHWPCDVRTAEVNYSSPTAYVDDAVYGGNHAYRRTLDATINVNSKVYRENGALANIFGAGYGAETWAECTRVNLNSGAEVDSVYGGGFAGKVLNRNTVRAWKAKDSSIFGDVEEGELPDGTYNTNVHIHQGAVVHGNAYGAGYGEGAILAGDASITLCGGVVRGDLYGGGYGGSVRHMLYQTKDEDGNVISSTALATANVLPATHAFILGGMVKNAFAGGQEANVGTTDHDGATFITVGIRDAAAPSATVYSGLPTVERSLYGGGQKGAVYGKAHLMLNSGYVGYKYIADTDPETGIETGTYEECLDLEPDEASNRIGKLAENGNVFGGGYDEGGTVDSTYVEMWGGVIRNSLYGGGEIAAIGRGTMKVETDTRRELDHIEAPGQTQVHMYGGHVLRDVFGGGRGFSYDLQGVELTGNVFLTNGYVFGETQVFIHSGEVGTSEGLAEGYGNVFGGGNVGFVYGYNERSDKETDSPDHYYYYKLNSEGRPTTQISEDCRVIIAPSVRVTGGSVTIADSTYQHGAFVPTDALNQLGRKSSVDDEHPTDPRWEQLDTEDGGVKIWNAVFAGGNVASNTTRTFANTVTVFGNATATLYDVYNWDFIEVGTEHTGGLYGGGNLAKVGGYRELNITNYGTAYYGLKEQISMDEYLALTNRERAYFDLQYRMKGDESYTSRNGKTYAPGALIVQEEYDEIREKYSDELVHWEQAGVCSIYAGRLLNTIQRADFCGVYGSRLVLQGAQDRVADVVDTKNYTLNRVSELSLNQQRSVADLDRSDADNAIHGNYFGIYSVVNYLSNLSSDVRFEDPRIYKESNENQKDDLSYYDYKSNNPTGRERNKGTSLNQIALASGVFLELTTERSTASDKDYGYVTGIVELDLINVTADEVGGGFVYARNEHGKRSEQLANDQITLSAYNEDAASWREYTYDQNNLQPFQTSGNFIHHNKRIVDDCYPNNGTYSDGYKASPAHYWYIKGEVYIYNETVSAYTGSATSYSQQVLIPLTITAASHGKLKLINIEQNRYAYFDESGKRMGEDGIKVNNQSVAYHLNDVINYWDWQLLPDNERSLFVEMTYVNSSECTVDGVHYQAGEFVRTKGELDDLIETKPEVAAIQNLFRPSNIVSHDKGYALSFSMISPADWDAYYTLSNSSSRDKIRQDAWEAVSNKSDYKAGPTYHPDEAGAYGQRDYKVGDILSQTTVNNYQTIDASYRNGNGQAKVEEAYVAVRQATYEYNGVTTLTNVGAAIPKSVYENLSALTVDGEPVGDKASVFQTARVCTSSLKLDEEDYIVYGALLSPGDISSLETKYPDMLADIESHLDNAYYCVEGGLYGGRAYAVANNYNATESWGSLTEGDRQHFQFNYDALDALYDPTFTKPISYYDNPDTAPIYSAVKSVDYKAIYTGSDDLTFSEQTIHPNDTIDRELFESVPNDKRHYTRVLVDPGGETFHFAKQVFVFGDRPYAVGELVEARIYERLNMEERNSFVEDVEIGNDNSSAVYKYYCYEDYTSIDDTPVKKGTVLDQGDYESVRNDQKNFTIQGMEPIGTVTLYMPRESDIEDLTQEKIITLIYQYTYYDTEDEEGEAIKQENELHVVNIHLHFESGAPTIAELEAPPVILPGETVRLKSPDVTPGITDILTNGWVLFSNEVDAQNHLNGQDYIPEQTPFYWYQNQRYFIAFCAQTFYGGYTYSNYVPVSVANYHDLRAVMADKEHHLYVDYDPDKLDRPSKIYVNDDTSDSQNGLSLFRDFFNLSYGQQPAGGGHAPLNPDVAGGANLEFFLRSDLQFAGGTGWTPLGSGADGHCFGGTLHGDGYTVSGLDHSLFHNLCGDVYNLGVTGSFTSAGLADTGDGYAENCWVSTTATAAAGVKPVIGEPTPDALRPMRLVNCYYPEENGYTAHSGTYGQPVAKPLRSFYNGEVAYDLNGFYLKERFDRNRAVGRTSAATAIGNTYVRDRYADGDFVYANGEKPLLNDDRQQVDEHGNVSFLPIWPDDYLYFGQRLNYGYGGGVHDPLPTHLVKTDLGRLLTTSGNQRVLRAPAYFRSKQMGVAHFNPNAILAANASGNTAQKVYPGLTALDFTGFGDVFASDGSLRPYQQGSTEGAGFYPPLLDADSLTAFTNAGLTRNLLVYIPAAATNEQNYSVLSGYLTGEPNEPVYAETDDRYRTVSATRDDDIHGHAVFQSGSATSSVYQATNDHRLVDLQSFNAPISYRFASGRRMWYQRTPASNRFVDLSSGWDGLSLPFTVQLVTTQTKGELTHFYDAATLGIDTALTQLGHEYWLRQYDGMQTPAGSTVATAQFNYPKATAADADREVGNTFLWDYYYSQSTTLHEGLDRNRDQYQQQYYAQSRTYPHYPLIQCAAPYLLGLPGTRYYEFDLSGGFTASTAPTEPATVAAQTVTMASAPGITIGVSDDELLGTTADGYTFVPNYMDVDIPAGGYALSADGSRFNRLTATAVAEPFRPYFLPAASPQAPTRSASEILFSRNSSAADHGIVDHDRPSDDPGLLSVSIRRGAIAVTSTLRSEAPVRITTIGGVTVRAFVIQPGQTVETPVHAAGVYIVNRKKYAVR